MRSGRSQKKFNKQSTCSQVGWVEVRNPTITVWWSKLRIEDFRSNLYEIGA